MRSPLLHRIFKMISSPDSTFHKLYSDIYFVRVLLLATRVRTMFWKTLVKVYSNLKGLTSGYKWSTNEQLPAHRQTSDRLPAFKIPWHSLSLKYLRNVNKKQTGQILSSEFTCCMQYFLNNIFFSQLL